MRATRFDGPFWAFVLLGALAVAAASCFGVSLRAAQAPKDAEILDTNRIALPVEL